MPNQTDEIIVSDHPPIEKQPVEKNKSWRKIGMYIFMLTMMILLVGFAYLTFILTTQLQTMKVQTVNLKDNLSTVQEKVESLHQSKTIEQQSQHAAVQQDQLVTELYSRLISLDTELEQLPLLITPKMMTSSSTVSSQVNQSGSWWKRGLDNTWQALRKIVIVRHLDPQAVPLITPEGKLFLYQNLHAQMDTAIWALLHHNQTIYHASLTRIIEWIPRYFIQDAPTTIKVLQELKALRQANIVTPIAAEAE